MRRRHFLGATGGLLASAVASESFADARDTYPAEPIRWVVGFPPGQTTDVFARMLAAKLSLELNGNVFIDNKPGAAGIISHQYVKSAKPNGYTLLMGSTATMAINPALYSKLPYDPGTDFEPISGLANSPMYLVAGPTVPVNNVREMVAYARANTSTAAYASSGNGTTQHIAMESLKKQGEFPLQHIPFKGSPDALTSIMSGQVPFGFDNAIVVTPLAKSGKLKLLGVSGAVRTAHFPDVPTIQEQGFAGFVITTWSALVAPAGTPANIVQALNAAAARVLVDKETVDYLSANSLNSIAGTPEQLRQLMREEIVRWRDAVRVSGAKVD